MKNTNLKYPWRDRLGKAPGKGSGKSKRNYCFIKYSTVFFSPRSTMEMSPGSWSPPRARASIRRTRAGRLSPSTTSRWPGIGGVGRGEPRLSSATALLPPRPRGARAPHRHPPTKPQPVSRFGGGPTGAQGRGRSVVRPPRRRAWPTPRSSPSQGFGIGRGGTPKRTRGAGAPGGKGGRGG